MLFYLLMIIWPCLYIFFVNKWSIPNIICYLELIEKAQNVINYQFSIPDVLALAGCLIRKSFNIWLMLSVSAESQLKGKQTKNVGNPSSRLWDEGNSCACVMTVEVEVSLGRPCLCTMSPIHLLHAASHFGRPSVHGDATFRLLFTLTNIKRAVPSTGPAANEKSVGGGWLAPISAAPGPRGQETGKDKQQKRPKLMLWASFTTETPHLEVTEKTWKRGAERLNWACRGWKKNKKRLINETALNVDQCLDIVAPLLV